MWKIAFAAITFSVSVGATTVSTTHLSYDHLRSAKIKYPYSLIGEDFGILNERDLAMNTCEAYPEPFSQTSTTFPYWQCFETKDVAFACDSSGVPDPHEGLQGIIVLTVEAKGGDRHEYLARRPWGIKSCRRFGKNFASLTRNTSHVCVSGSFSRLETDERGTRVSRWTFDKYKTHKGCDSYFEGDCDLGFKIKHGCKVSQADGVFPLSRGDSTSVRER